jgi:hypothetical protein
MAVIGSVRLAFIEKTKGRACPSFFRQTWQANSARNNPLVSLRGAVEGDRTERFKSEAVTKNSFGLKAGSYSTTIPCTG